MEILVFSPIMERRKTHLILNPVANKGRAGRLLGDISNFLGGFGLSPEWHVTDAPGDAARIARELPEDETAVAVGGDGTAHEVASACVGTGRVMGILPAGSGNDYVKALGIGSDLRRALGVIAAGNVRVVDAGEVNGVHFNNGLGIGFDAEVAAGVKIAPSYLGGTGRYMWSVGRLLWGFTCHEATLTLDGGKAIEAETILVAAALGTTYGAMFKLAPESKLDDGLFDVVWSEKISRLDVMHIIPSALAGTILRHDEVNMARAENLEVKMADAVPAHVDGEILAPTRDFEAKVLPGSLRVLAP
ncbi:MAG: diacylglycerol kinase family lipid kinase [Rubrobacter sp.]|nr:diacylglycerol kinase family lipid kinase [Rubrobacter sp.]